jgi:hypothetical protein
MYSKDPELGITIHKLLLEKKVESPALCNKLNSDSFDSFDRFDQYDSFDSFFSKPTIKNNQLL